MRIGRSVDVREPLIIASFFFLCRQPSNGGEGVAEVEIVDIHPVIEVHSEALLGNGEKSVAGVGAPLIDRFPCAMFALQIIPMQDQFLKDWLNRLLGVHEPVG